MSISICVSGMTRKLLLNGCTGRVCCSLRVSTDQPPRNSPIIQRLRCLDDLSLHFLFPIFTHHCAPLINELGWAGRGESGLCVFGQYDLSMVQECESLVRDLLILPICSLIHISEDWAHAPFPSEKKQKEPQDFRQEKNSKEREIMSLHCFVLIKCGP